MNTTSVLGMLLVLDLEPKDELVGDVRRFFRRTLGLCGFASEYISDVELLASELVANAMREARRPVYAGRSLSVQVRVRFSGDKLVLTFWDPSPSLPIRKPASMVAESGRGVGISDDVIRSHSGRRGTRSRTLGGHLGKDVRVELAAA